MEETEVSELIKYCEELEDEVIEFNNKFRNNKEIIIYEFLKELSNSCDDLLKTDLENARFDLGEINFKESIITLNKNIKTFFKDNKL